MFLSPRLLLVCQRTACVYALISILVKNQLLDVDLSPTFKISWVILTEMPRKLSQIAQLERVKIRHWQKRGAQ